VPEYHASAERGPKIQSHQATATAVGDGSDALDTNPAAVTASQAIRIATGSAIRLTKRENLILVDCLFSSNSCALISGAPRGTASDKKVRAMS
jgi:hypothetical protein